MSFTYSDVNAEADASSPYGVAVSEVVSAKPFLAVLGFGLQAGTSLRVDYIHRIEYIPTIQAAGIVARRLQLPSVGAKQAISHGIADLISQLGGSTDAGMISRYAGSLASTAKDWFSNNFGSIGQALMDWGPTVAGAVNAGSRLLEGAGAMSSALTVI